MLVRGSELLERLHRREWLKRSALLGGAVLFGSAGVAALAEPGGGVPVRRELSGMSPDDPTLRTFREGVRMMRERSEKEPLDPLGWHVYGGQHSIFCATNAFRMQIHYGSYFLPWHRAYLSNLEQKIRTLTGDRGFALPYWDWTRHPRIPAALFGEANPLNDTTRIQGPDDELPADFTEMGPSMRGRAFHQFGGVLRDPSKPQVEGTLEQSAHNNVHNWIGGNMASFDGAGFDPMFATHHGAVDRMWEAWKAASPANRDPTEQAWLEHRFSFYGPNGAVRKVRIADLLDTEALGYRFDTLSWRSTLTPSRTPTYPGGGEVVARFRPDEALKAAVRRIAAGQPGRALLQYQRVQIPIHPLCHRVFIHPSSPEGAPRGKAVYCGTFTLLPISDANNGLEKLVSTQMELPVEALPLLLGDGPVALTAVPVALKGRSIPQTPLQLDGVALLIES